MKKIILILFVLISIAMNAQDFEKNWDNVIALEKESKIKSASEEVEKIYAFAKKQNNEPQIIKTFFYRSKYILKLNEEAQTMIFTNLANEIKSVSIPSKAILQLVYADCLDSYAEKNRYEIQRRTDVEITSDPDFQTWSYKMLKVAARKQYDNSLDNEKVLKATPLLKYKEIFEFEKQENIEGKTIYDYLIQENINYYQHVLNPSYFNLSSESLADAAYSITEFKNTSFEKLQDKTLVRLIKIYQKIEKENPNNLRLVLDRVHYLNGFIFRDKKKYISFLNSIQKKTSNLELSQEILLKKALHFHEEADKAKTPLNNIIAISIIDSIEKNINRSNSYKNAVILKNAIKIKNLNVALKTAVYNNENTRASVNFKNIDTLLMTFYKIPSRFKNFIESNVKNRDSIIISRLKDFEIFASKEILLPNKHDYFDQTTEVLLPNLKTGTYLAIFKSTKDPITEKDINYTIMTSSDFIVAASQDAKHTIYEVYNRKTGFPIHDVTVETDNKKAKTDKNGIAKFQIEKKTKNNYGLKNIQLSKENDSLSLRLYGSNTYNFFIESEESFTAKATIYTDRAIYRPGQTAYAKAILTQSKNGIQSIVPDINVSAEIEDQNGNTLKNMELKTNEFGSIQFEFQIPKTGLTGEFTILINEPDDIKEDAVAKFWDDVDFENSQNTFSVEEYKRPTFEIKFDAVKNNFSVNDSIKASGSAIAFSGSKISDAKVIYTVKRATRPTYGTRNFWNPDEKPIFSGETKTDAEGKFTIDFKALPEDGTDKKVLPVFEYTVTADITDINGETRSQTTIINAGYHTLKLSAKIPSEIDLKEKTAPKIVLDSKNLNNEFTSAEGNVKIYFLSEINKKFKKRQFTKPDISLISDADFEKLFPFEDNSFADENATGTLVYSKKINTETDKEILVDFMSGWKSGSYRLEFTANDSKDNLIKNVSNFKLFDSRKDRKNNQLFEVTQINTNPKKDGFVDISIKSDIPELFISGTGFYHSQIFYDKSVILKNGQATIRIPIGKEINDDLIVRFESVFDNDSYSDEIAINTKNDIENLEIEVITLRNKIEPGAKETWSFKLNHINKKIEAEVLASMYDSSLDQFEKDFWQLLRTSPTYNYARPKIFTGFDSNSIFVETFNSQLPHFNFTNKNYGLNWFGFDFNNSYYKIQKYNTQIQKSKAPLDAKLVHGIITEAGLPVPGVAVIVATTDRSVISDFDGYYEILVADNEELQFSFIGTKPLTKKVTGTELDVNLESDANYLETVVVETGYDSIKTKSSTSYALANIEYRSNSSILSSLQGMAPGLTISGTPGVQQTFAIRGAASIGGSKNALLIVDGVPLGEEEVKNINSDEIENITILKDASATAIYGARGANGVIIITTKASLESLSKVQTRKNFNETAFFYPQIRTDKNGKFSFKFTSPEALTKWKLRLLAHNKKAVSGYLESNIITQKELMVQPNMPRFLREKDSITITTKISNLTPEPKSGLAILQLFDATTMEAVDTKMNNLANTKNFSSTANGNTTVSWKIYVPEGLQGVQYKIIAKAGNFSDGEENILPVLTNNMLVTESIPLWVRENTTKEYTFENLKSNTSSTLRNQQLTLEYTSNPTWLAIQSLPYLMEYEHECAEQTFARYYANALASEILNSNPKIAEVFEIWKKSDKPVSKLAQNEELKSILLAETPWLADAQNEEEKKKNLALLFDLDKMKDSQKTVLEKLAKKQKSSGGFAWFDDGEESEYITRHILSGLGHLRKLTHKKTDDLDQTSKKGIDFLDQKFLDNHIITDKKENQTKLIWKNPYQNLHYLYTRSLYFDCYPMGKNLERVTALYIKEIEKNWVRYSLYEKAMASLVLSRFGDQENAKKIIESLRQTASTNEEWGMYWIENKSGWYWYQAPIETQALLIEAFAEIDNDKKSVEAMKVWLLKNKQTKNWPTTKATTEAVYALLMQGSDWISVKDKTTFKIGDEKMLQKKLAENEKEAGTGYVKLNWKADEIKKDMATLSIKNNSEVPGFGGFYWQYFEDLDKIKSSQESPMTVEKELYLKANTSEGKQLQRITDKKSLKIGDLVTVRLLISTKEDMEFVHLKDMRASCFEPIDVISAYKYQGGLGFYQSTKDVATHFFFDHIKKGKFVLEYDIRVNNLGDFSNGITTIQSMYAPEFSSHTKGIRVKIKE